MQNLDVISVNIWQILISLCNLVILFFIIRRFLYKPVKKMLAERRSQVEKIYSDAQLAKEQALSDREKWSAKIASADKEADSMIEKARSDAQRMEKQMTDEAKQKADSIIRSAKTQAQAEKKNAQNEIRSQIADVSVLIAEKLIQREINEDDHRSVIDSAISEMGEDDDG